MTTSVRSTDSKRRARPKFARLLLPRILNYLMFCFGCFLAGTGLALAYRMPPGSRGGHGLTMLGLDRHEWGDLHLYVGLAIGVLVLIHLGLHWGWLKSALRSARMRLGWIGLGVGLLLLAAPLLLPVNGERGGGGSGGHAEGSEAEEGREGAVSPGVEIGSQSAYASHRLLSGDD